MTRTAADIEPQVGRDPVSGDEEMEGDLELDDLAGISRRGQVGKFGDAFSRILGKRALQSIGGLDKLERRATKTVRKEKPSQEEAQQAAARVARVQRQALRCRGRVAPGKKGQDPAADREQRRLLVTATRGVVKLFNAVRKAQRDLDEDRGDEPSAAPMTKAGFLDQLKGTAKPGAPGSKADHRGRTALTMFPTSSEQGSIAAAAGQPGGGSTWEVFREDFLHGRNRLRDWDKGVPTETSELDGESAPGAAQRMDDNSDDDSDF